MQDQGDRRILFPGRLIAAFEASGRAVENDFRHVYSACDRKIGFRVANLTWGCAASRTDLKFR
ncbi:hypothetical protein D9M68_972700 [compost metagenome]